MVISTIGLFYICELNEDMISVKDLNGDGKITSGLFSDPDPEELELRQTFHTIIELDDESGISFESVAYPGYYLAIVDDVLTLTDGSGDATFYVTDEIINANAAA